MEFVKFFFTDFWHFVGMMCCIGGISIGVARIVLAFRGTILRDD
jgi:hypothetical protein